MSSKQRQPVSGRELVAKSHELDFSLVLARTIESIQGDPAQLRHSVYELARMKLQRELWRQSPSMNFLESQRLKLALETAIERVETVSVEREPLRLPQSFDELLAQPESPADGYETTPLVPALTYDRAPYRISYADVPPPTAPAITYVPVEHAEPRSVRFTAAIAAATAAVTVVLLLLTIQWLALFAPPPDSTVSSNAHREPNAAVQPVASEVGAPSPPTTVQSPSIPLPSVYGVYAMTGGQLRELAALPGRVPDQKVFMSVLIKTPSRTMLPDGHVSFVVYRRDVATVAPERIAVRVIAKITRAMGFNAGKAITTDVDDEWSIRGTSYDFRVAPVPENSEMLMVLPENSEFTLPAGRYALVLKGLAYDFVVEGQVTDAAHCLERVDAGNGTFYTECRKP